MQLQPSKSSSEEDEHPRLKSFPPIDKYLFDAKSTLPQQKPSFKINHNLLGGSSNPLATKGAAAPQQQPLTVN
jgi:hypothetical protein